MDAAKEWPKILGFADGSTVDEKTVEQHYRQQAKVLHPDVGGSTDDMQQLNLAKGLALKWVERERQRIERPVAVTPLVNPMYATMARQQQYTAAQQQYAAQGANAYGYANAQQYATSNAQKHADSMANAAAQQRTSSGGWMREILGGLFK